VQKPGTVSDSCDPVAKAESQGHHAGIRIVTCMYLCLKEDTCLRECMNGGHCDCCFSGMGGQLWTIKACRILVYQLMQLINMHLHMALCMCHQTSCCIYSHNYCCVIKHFVECIKTQADVPYKRDVSPP